MIVGACMLLAIYLILTSRTAQGNYPNAQSGKVAAGEWRIHISGGF
jgi:hypothetical protein